MQVKLMIFLLMLMVSTGCRKYDFDGFDPPTSAMRWIIKGGNSD